MKLGIWLSVTLLCSHVLSCASAISDEEKKRIGDFINGVMQCNGVPGASFALVEDRVTSMAQGFGVANIESSAPVTPKTKFGIADLTKSFSAALLSEIFNEESQAAWDTPVKQMLPSWFSFSDGYRSNEATMTDLFSHQVATGRHEFPWILGAVDREQLMRSLRFFKPLKEFRTAYIYSNNYYAVGAYLMEKLKGQTWEALTTDRLLNPLKMADTTFIDRAAPSWTGFATPYLVDANNNLVATPFESIETLGVPGASGSMASTAEDMARYLKFQLSEGLNENGDQVVNDTALRTTYFAQFGPWGTEDFRYIRPSYHVSDTQDQYGFGWFTGYYRGYPKRTYSGDYYGYHSFITVIPSKKIGIYVALNSQGSKGDIRDLIHQFVADVVMGETPWLTVDRVCNMTQSESSHTWWEDVPLSERSRLGILSDITISTNNEIRVIGDYLGVFGRFGYGNVTISSGDSANKLRMTYGTRGTFDMYQTANEDVFTLVGVGPASVFNIGDVTFSRSSGGGPVDRLTIPGFEPLDPPVFIRDLKMSQAPPAPSDNCSPRFT